MEKQQSSTLSILSLVFGIIGLLSAIVLIGFLPAAAGIVLGALALSNKEPAKGMAIAGIACGSVGALIAFCMFALLYGIGSRTEDTGSSHDIEAETAETNTVTVEGTAYVEPKEDESGLWANEFTPISDFRYTLDKDAKTITLIRYEGEDEKIMLSPVYHIDDIDYTLVSMGDDACFLSETYITSVYIPDGVTFIGASCFNSCASLKCIYLPASIEEIPNTFFSYFDGYNVYCNAESSIEKGSRDMTQYSESDESYTNSEELGESLGRGVNGFFAGLNSEYDTEHIVDIYYGGTDEQWAALVDG